MTVRSISLEEMQQKFGEDSIWVYEILRGIDRTEVKEKQTLNKSMMASKNLPRPVTKTSEGPHWLRVLAAELALRLNELRATDISVWPKTIVLHARHRYDWSRSKQTPFPFTRNVTVDLIAGLAEKLWKDLVGSDSKQDGSLSFSVTTISLGFSGVEPGEVGQQSIEGFFRTGRSTKPPSSSDGHDGEVLQIHHGKRRLESQDGDGSSLDMLGINQGDVVSFACSRCGKHIEVEPRNDGEGKAEQRQAEALTRLRMEHGDFHVAEDLSKAPYDGNLGGSPGLRVVERESKRKRESNARKDKHGEGIAKFFGSQARLSRSE